MARLSTDADLNSIRIKEASAPSTPASGYFQIYAKSDGKLYTLNDSGAEVCITDLGGSGGRTLLATLTPTGTGTASFTSISGSYKKLTVEFAIRSTQAATFVAATVVLNSDTTAANYRSQLLVITGAGSVSGGGADDNSLGNSISANSSPANSFSVGIMEIPFYANTNINKQVLVRTGNRRDASSIQEALWMNTIEWESTAAITQIDIVLGAGNYATNSTLYLYGES